MNNQNNEKLNKLLDMFSSKLTLLSNYGLELMKQLAQTGPLKTEHIPIVLSLRHSMELLEGISILIKNNLADPSLFLLRGIFESVIQTSYILDKDTCKRGTAFMYYDLLNNIEWHENIDVTTQKGRSFLSLLEKDIYTRSMKLNKPEDYNEKLASLKKQRKNSTYSEVHAEYEKQKLHGKRVNKWFSLFNGPKNIEQVATNVGLGGTYQIFYRQLSEAVHGTGIIRGKVFSDAGKGSILDIKAPYNIQYVVSTSISLSGHLFLKIIDSMCPEKRPEYRDFYIREIREISLRVSKQDYIKINM